MVEINIVQKCLTVFLFCVVLSYASGETEYNVGIGIADITGPAAEVNMVYILLYFMLSSL